MKKREEKKKKNKYMDRNESNLARKILNKCIIDLSIVKNGYTNYLIIKKIRAGQNNEEISVDKFNNYLKSSTGFKNSNDALIDKSYRFANFIKNFKERIINEYKNNFYLNLQIEIKNTNAPNKGNSFNLEAIYTVYPPLDGELWKYREDNILEYCVKSKMEGFNLMIANLNPYYFWLNSVLKISNKD